MSRARDAMLLGQLRQKDEELSLSREALHAAQQEIRLLRQKLDALARRMFGKSSEKLDAAQMQLLLEGLEEIAGAQADTQFADAPATQNEDADVKTTPARERGPRVPEHLPVREIIIDPEEVKASPDQWKRIGEEVTEQLDYTPGSFTRLRIVRRKYVHRENRHEPPVIAPLVPTLQERCLAAPSLLAHAFVSRYRDHLPWYRLENIYAGLGVSISRQTLGNWSGMAADAVQLVIKEIRHSVFAGEHVQIDETPIEYLGPGDGAVLVEGVGRVSGAEQLTKAGAASCGGEAVAANQSCGAKRHHVIKWLSALSKTSPVMLRRVRMISGS